MSETQEPTPSADAAEEAKKRAEEAGKRADEALDKADKLGEEVTDESEKPAEA